jgi:hypothetical protein
MRVGRLRLLKVIALVAVAAAAAWTLPRHPIAGVPLLVLLLFLASLDARNHLVARRVVAAGLRCDLDALDALARKKAFFGRLAALVTWLHHGGFDRPPAALGGAFETIDAELDVTRRVLQLAWTTSGNEALELTLSSQPIPDATIPPVCVELFVPLRLINRIISHAADVSAQPPPEGEERPAWFAGGLEVAQSVWPSLRWPLRLAAAREALARGDRASAGRDLEGMPTWPEGSSLERVRRALVNEVAALPDA